jgi:signal transduction histidine kinase
MGEDGADGDAELRLVAERAEADTRITIRDSGPGIDDDAIDRLFNPFFTTRSTGTGLGLPIVHRLLDAHGGSISVRNDGGAVFQISLPHPPEESTRAESCPADEAQSNPQVASTTNQYSGAAA